MRAIDIEVESLKVSSGLRLECEMTTAQMKSALEAFLTRITDDEWERWVREYAADILAEEHAAGMSAGAAS